MRVVDQANNEVPVGERDEIQIAGHNVVKRYWNLSEATAAAIDEDGWFSTGDVGTIDGEGRFHIVDRTRRTSPFAAG